jgi:hypothetical protein
MCIAGHGRERAGTRYLASQRQYMLETGPSVLAQACPGHVCVCVCVYNTHTYTEYTHTHTQDTHTHIHNIYTHI